MLSVKIFRFPLNFTTSSLRYGLAAFFVLVNLGYFLLGVRYDYAPLYYSAQFLDTNLLRSNLFESLFYLHSQPPLFNFFLGVVLNLFPDNLQLALALIYLAGGLVLTLVLFSLMVKLGANPRLAYVITALFIASPAFILLENWIYSTFFEALFLSLAALLLHNFTERGSLKSGIAFFSVLALLVLLRSSFHLVWFVGVALFIIVLNRQNWRKILLAGAIPFLIIFALYGKNLLLFGSFSSSTWLGMNVSAVAFPDTPPQNLDELIQSGAISPVALIPRFDTLASYSQFLPLSAKTGIPALDQETRYVPHTVIEQFNVKTPLNYNNLNYIAISEQYLKSDLYFVTHQPLAALKNVVIGSIIGFRPTSHYFVFSEANLNAIKPVDGLYTFLFDGDFLQTLNSGNIPFWANNSVSDIGWFILARFIIAIIFGVKLLWGIKNSKRPKPFTITIFFIVSTIIYYTSVSNLLDYGENNRFRFDIDPFCLIIFTLFLQQTFLHFRKRTLESAAPNDQSSGQTQANPEFIAG